MEGGGERITITMLTLLESFLEIHPKVPGVKLGDTAVSLSFKSFKKCDVSAAE